MALLLTHSFFRSACETTSSGVPAVHDGIQWLAVVMISPHTSLTAMLQNVTKSIVVSYRAQIGCPKDIVLQSQQSVKIQMPKWLFKHCTAPTMIYFQTLLFAS